MLLKFVSIAVVSLLIAGCGKQEKIECIVTKNTSIIEVKLYKEDVDSHTMVVRESILLNLKNGTYFANPSSETALRGWELVTLCGEDMNEKLGDNDIRRIIEITAKQNSL